MYEKVLGKGAVKIIKGNVCTFCEAMIEIRKEVQEITDGKMPKEGNLLKNAPHPVGALLESGDEGKDGWKRPYSRERAAYPLPWLVFGSFSGREPI